MGVFFVQKTCYITNTKSLIQKNMKKFITLSLIILAITACTPKYKPDTSGLTPEFKQKEETRLNDFKTKYSQAQNDSDKEKYAFETGFRYMNLGDYDNAIKYYEIVLKLNADHPQALNNMAVMYEEMGDIKQALKYEQKLYNKNTTNTEVVSDTIRLLAKNKQFIDAQGVLDTFAKTEEGKKQGPFLSEQMKFLKDEEAKEKAKK